MIRLAAPSIEEDDLEAVREALASGQLVQGARVAAFEQAIAREVGTAHAVAVSNGTAALQLALLALGVGPGDRVVTTAYSWISTANAIELCGATPVFADIEPDTFNVSPAAIRDALAKAKPRAILPVHAFGQMADMPAILEAAGDVPVIEDAACALGATWNGARAGGAGTMGCFSFHPRKAVTTGEGGAVTTNDAALADRVRALRNHGQDPNATSGPDFVMPGFNMRLTELQAALGVTQMKKLARIVDARRRVASRYDARFRGTRITPPAVPAASRPVYQTYVALLPEDVAPRRAEILRELAARGVQASIGTWHMPMTTFYRQKYGFSAGDFPVTDAVFARSVALPSFEAITDAEIDEVATKLLALVG